MNDIMRQIAAGANQERQTRRELQAEARREEIDHTRKLKRAGYVRLSTGLHSEGADATYSHLPCGGAVTSPDVHDPMCPANSNGRLTPLLSEL